MKQLYLAITILLLHATAWAYPTGSNFTANYSGISGVTCNASGCHAGTINAGPGSVSITTNIPVTGYVAGALYQITVTVSSGGSNGVSYGFACSAAKDGSTAPIGGFATDGPGTLVKSGGNYIVHNSAAIGNGDTSHTFTFNWTAPAAGTGAVKFFAAGNSANGNGSTSGDHIYNSTLSINEMPSLGLVESIISAFDLYPNPATEFVHVNVPEGLVDSQIRLVDITGKTIVSMRLTQQIVQLDLNMIPAGIYIVDVVKDGQSYTSRLIKE